MDNAIYVGLSRQMTLQRQLDIAANNLANVDTAGFKLEQLMLQSDPLRPQAGGSRLDPIKYVIDDGVARSFAPGALDATDRKLDFAIDGDGFFQVRTAQGVRYTRDGRFTLDAENKLVTQGGDAVLDDGGSEITLDPNKGEVSVAKTGQISQGGAPGPKVGVVRFADKGRLSKTGEEMFTTAEAAAPAADAQVRQGYLEKSNVQPVLEITHLIEITRSYERVASMMNSAHELSRSAVQRLGKAA